MRTILSSLKERRQVKIVKPLSLRLESRGRNGASARGAMGRTRNKGHQIGEDLDCDKVVNILHMESFVRFCDGLRPVLDPIGSTTGR